MNEAAYSTILRRLGVEPSPVPDLQTWRDLAALSVGIKQDSPLYRPMLNALSDCDEAYRRNDWPAFWREAERAKALVGQPVKGAA